VTEVEIELLKQSLGKDVELTFTDGDVLQPHLVFVSEGLIASNMIDRYQSQPRNAAYRTPFEQISSIRIL
jgi:hypothetical protein